MVKLKRKENTAIEAVQFHASNAIPVIEFAGDVVDFVGDAGLIYPQRPNSLSQSFVDGDWICKDAEGYFYVLADSLKQKIYDEV